MKYRIQSLVVGVDFSKYSKLVAQEAKALAQKIDVPIIYVYVYQDISAYQDTFGLVMPKLTTKFETEIRKKYQTKDEDQIHVKFGRADDEIIKSAKKYPSPLIMIGHRGTNPLVRWVLGSTAENLAINSPFPLWIHRGENVVIPKRILIPCDLSENSDRTIQRIEPLKKALRATVELLHVIEEPLPVLDTQTWATVYKEMMKIDDIKTRAFRKKHSKLKTVRSIGGAAVNIQKRSEHFDLIALTPREHKKNRMAFGSVTSKLIRSGHKPILVIP